MAATFGFCAGAGGARDAAGTLVGICVWQRPGTYPLPVGAQATEMVGALRALIPRPPAVLKGLRYTLAMEKARPREEHWYLCLLAADPMAWRRGIGTALLEPGLETVDADAAGFNLDRQDLRLASLPPRDLVAAAG